MVGTVVIRAPRASPTQTLSTITQKPVGLVLNVGCPAWLESQEFGKPMLIDDLHDRGCPLYVGDKLSCKGSGE